MNSLAEQVAKISVLAGQTLRENYTGVVEVLSDKEKDIKLAADMDIEKLIVPALSDLKVAPILSEEGGGSVGSDHIGRRWIVDPLDGSMNFSRGIPIFSVSIGLWNVDVPELGVIHDVVANDTFVGIPGRGAFLNGEPIHVSGIKDAGRAVLATGFPSGRDYGQESLTEFVDCVRTFKKVRLIGSAALSLAWVAAGRMDAYCEEDISLWDVAAGLALVAAAGGRFQMAHTKGVQNQVFADNGWLEWSPLQQADNSV